MLHAAPVVYAAKLDSTPLLVMDINLDSALDLREALQDSTANYLAMQPLAKYIRKVVVPDDLPLAVRQAVLAAGTGRPGPAVLDLPFQVLVRPTDCPAEPLRLPDPPAAAPATLDSITELLRRSQRPVLFVGAGAQLSHAGEEVQQLAELLGVPVVSTSWGGRGVISDDHPQFAGVVGSFGWESANDVVQRSDCWLAIGTSFSQMTTGAWNINRPANVIQVDIDPNQLGKIFQPSIGVVGDAKVVLEQLTDAVAQLNPPLTDEATATARRKDVAQSQQEWQEYLGRLSAEGGNPINQYHVLKKMSDILPEGTIVVG